MERKKKAIIAILSFSLLIMGCPDPDTEKPMVVDYTKLKLNEVSGVGDDSEKFYELINIGTKDIPLQGCKIYYNANGSTGGTLPTAKGSLTWTGSASQTIKTGELFSLIGTGLTAERILIITLEDPKGKVIDKCVRAADTGDYAITDKSFSRIPDGTGDFYFTAPTPKAANGTSAAGLTKVPVGPPVKPPVDPPVFSDLRRTPFSVTPLNTVTVSATVTTTTSTITTVVIKWKLGGTAQSDIPMTKNGNVYSAVIPGQALGSVVTYTVFATNALGETNSSNEQSYTVVSESESIDYTKLKLNEVSGVGPNDSEKFYELKNIGTKNIPLEGCKIYYNANSATGEMLPIGKGSRTWTGLSTQTINAGELFPLIGRNTPGSFTSGLTAARILIITLEDPAGNEIDRCVRAKDTGEYEITDKSFSRIPDGTGPFYFTTPTPNATNGTSTDGFTRVPSAPLDISDLRRSLASVTPPDTVTVSATVTPTAASAISTVVLQWTLNGAAPSNINMTPSGNVYSAVIPAQAVGSAVTYKVSATNALGETYSSVEKKYTVVSEPIVYADLKLNEVGGVGDDSTKFYELKNIGDKDIPLEDCKIWYNANSATGGTLPTGKGDLTWTGLPTQIAQAGQFFTLEGRDDPPGTKPGSFTRGLTAARILIITLEDPAGNEIDRCVRTADTGEYAITDKSFSRIPDGTGEFYFTDRTPNVTNNTPFVDLLTKLPVAPVISGLNRTPSSVTPTNTVTVSATVEPITASAIPTVVLQWTLNGTAETDISMTKGNGNVYSAEIPAQAVDSTVTYKVAASATNAPDETNSSVGQTYIVISTAVVYTKLVLNEVNGNKKFVEIYNSGDVDIPMEGVKLQRNDGQSQWVGTESDSIPAGQYRLILFNGATGLDTNQAYKGWTVSSGISSSQILKVAIVDPAGNPVSVFIRGNVPLPAWGNTSGVTQSNNSYSRMSDGTWVYADPTPGAANGAKTGDIVNPGYLTAQP